MIIKFENKSLARFFEPVLLILFWLLLFASPFIMRGSEYGFDWTHIFKVWISFVPYLILFLLNRFVFLPLLFFKNRRVLFLLVNIVLIANMAWIADYFDMNSRGLDKRLPHHEQAFKPQGDLGGPPLHLRQGRPGGSGAPGGPDGRPPKQLPPLISFVVISILIIGFDTGLKLSVKWMQSEQQRAKAEKQSVENQLAFLRNQVSPHFFMNTLNNIHSLIDIDTEEAKESIIRLSKLMRHLLYDSEQNKIAIEKEFEFIRNYVDLMKLRFSDKVKISLLFPTEIPLKSIPPLLFTSFLENAFKHGISYQSESFVTIVFRIHDDMLDFEIINSNPESNGEKTNGGIGIVNSKKRLELLYGDDYDLAINEDKNQYKVVLRIPM